MRYKVRPPVKANKFNKMDLIDINRERFDLFCDAFGGMEVVSKEIGYSQEYLYNALRNNCGKIPFPAYVLICDTYGLPDKFLMGYGEKRDLIKWIKRNAPERKEHKQKHAVVDAYCKDCMYRSKAPSPNLPVEDCCDYYFVTKVMRGCPAGTGCTRKSSGVLKRARPLVICR